MLCAVCSPTACRELCCCTVFYICWAVGCHWRSTAVDKIHRGGQEQLVWIGGGPCGGLLRIWPDSVRIPTFCRKNVLETYLPLCQIHSWTQAWNSKSEPKLGMGPPCCCPSSNFLVVGWAWKKDTGECRRSALYFPIHFFAFQYTDLCITNLCSPSHQSCADGDYGMFNLSTPNSWARSTSIPWKRETCTEHLQGCR